MPISSWQAISDITAEIIRLNPQSVLDLGCGFGLYGAICRNYLDAMHGRLKAEDWQVSIIGFEAFSGYLNPAWLLYDIVYERNFTQSGWEPSNYELVLMIDSLEHLYRFEGMAFLDKLVTNNKHVIVSVPNGLMEQGAAHGNEFERHKTTFHGPEFDRFPGVKILHKSLCIAVSIPGKM